MNNETRIKYNGVDIRSVLTESINQRVQLDATNTDPIYVVTEASFTGILHTQVDAQANPWHGINGPLYGSEFEGEVGPAFQKLLYLLNQPRRRFEMWIGDRCVMGCVAGHERVVGNPNVNDRLPIENTDCNHGPLPSLTVLSVVSAYTLRVRFNVTLHIPWCDMHYISQPDKANGLISFRFWIAENINCDDWTTTRTYRGKLRVRHLGHNVHLAFRANFWLPALQLGFVRRKVSMEQSQNGLELDFMIEDQEVWAVPPMPSTKWSGYHRLFSPEPGLQTLHSDFRVELEASKGVGKRYLMALAQRIAEAKLHIVNVNEKQQCFLDSASWEDTLPDNRVAIAMSATHYAPGPAMLDFCCPLNELLQPMIPLAGMPPYDPAIEWRQNPTATLQGLFLAFLNDPLHVAGWPNTWLQVPQPQIPPQGQENQPPADNQGQGPGVDPQAVAPFGADGVYTIYRTSSDYDLDTGMIGMPFALRHGQATDKIAVFPRVHNGAATRTISIQAERLGSWPKVPDGSAFTVGGVTHYCLSMHPHLTGPILSADFTKMLFRIDAVYRYMLDKYPFVTSGLLRPAMPLNHNGAWIPQLRWVPGDTFVTPLELL